MFNHLISLIFWSFRNRGLKHNDGEAILFSEQHALFELCTHTNLSVQNSFSKFLFSINFFHMFILITWSLFFMLVYAYVSSHIYGMLFCTYTLLWIGNISGANYNYWKSEYFEICITLPNFVFSTIIRKQDI